MSGRISLGAALAGQFFLLLLALLLPDEARADRSLTLLFAGDVMLDDGPGRLIARGGDPLAPFAAILARADYRIANLETPIAESGRAHPNKIFTFRSRPEVLRVLQGRFDAVSLANNHSGDYGQSAFLETIALLDAQGVGHFGGGRDLAEAHAPLWIVRDGLKIAVLGYNEYKPRSFEAGAGWPGIAWSEDSQVLADIRAARADGADLVIPFMHWGWEGMPLADARAAAVVGGHPHVTQDVEIHRGRPIIYSLGNFVFDGFERREEKTGWLLRLRLDAEGVVAWDTLEARINADGTPHPVLGARTPCGRRGGREVRACTASDW